MTAFVELVSKIIPNTKEIKEKIKVTIEAFSKLFLENCGKINNIGENRV